MHANCFFRLTAVAATLAAHALLGGAALAGDTATKPAPAGASPQVTFDPKQFVLPNVSDDASTFTPKGLADDEPAFSMPQIDLGTSQLSVETNRNAINNGPRVGIEKIDPTVLNPNLPQHKESPLQPFVGFKLSTPME